MTMLLADAVDVLKKLSVQFSALGVLADACDTVWTASGRLRETEELLETAKAGLAAFTDESQKRKAAAESEIQSAKKVVDDYKKVHELQREETDKKTRTIREMADAANAAARAEVAGAQAIAKEKVEELRTWAISERAKISVEHNVFKQNVQAEQDALTSQLDELKAELTAIKAKISPLLA